MMLLDRWRIARCVEEGRELPADLARRVRASRGLSEYCSNLTRVETSLRRSTPPVDIAPPGLVDSVLARLGAGEAPRARALPWRAMVGAAAAVAGIAVVVLWPGAALPVSPTASRAWPDAGAIARTAVEQPLVREARLLAQDTRRAADMVLASFPSARSGGK